MMPRSQWATYKLGDLAQYINGKAFKPAEWKSSGRPIIRIQNLTDASKPFNYCGGEVEPRYIVNDGDLLISWSATLGSFIWNRGPAVLNQHIFKVLPNASIVDRDFLHYLALNTLSEMEEQAHGLAMKHITKTKFESIAVSAPPLPEQHRIVSRIKECMERADELERLRTQTGVEAVELELACFHDALLGGLRHERWPLLTLGDVVKSLKYGTSAKAHREPDGCPIVRMGNLKDGYLDVSDLKYVELPQAQAARCRLQVGDVLINRTNSLELVGKAATFDIEHGNWVYASYLVKAEVDRARVLPEFVTAVINSSMGRDYVLRTARRAIGMVNLNAKEMAKFPMPVPPLDEQKAIIEKLQATRKLACSLRTAMDDQPIALLRQSVLEKAFAGEL